MKTGRQTKILELIEQYDIETQEELSSYLQQAGYQVTQATVSRDIRELKLTKIALGNGRQKYAPVPKAKEPLAEKYVRVFREGFLSMDMAQNILVIQTVSLWRHLPARPQTICPQEDRLLPRRRR